MFMGVLRTIDRSRIRKKMYKGEEETRYQDVSRSETMMYRTLLKSQVGVHSSPSGLGDTMRKWFKEQSI